LSVAGKVYIVGAGCGDPELLTVKAYKLLTEYAEVLIYDKLIPKEIINLVTSQCEKIYAGKSCKQHVMTQEEINQELVKQAKLGKKVVRLKGGDPFIFGRGGEEAIFLKESGIEFEVIAGISAASGISSKLNIPLTHRGVASSVTFITGHKQDGKQLINNWEHFANEGSTLVIYMGLANLKEITSGLVNNGMDKNTPAVIIQNGTMADEKVLFSNVNDIAEKAVMAELTSPCITIIGRVVGIV
jgi:uroporphyrin-III C-methyltransferase